MKNVIVFFLVSFLCWEVVFFYTAPHYSIVARISRHILVGDALERAHRFALHYTAAGGLRSDERILFAHAFPHDQQWRMYPHSGNRKDPFMRMVDNHFTDARPRVINTSMKNATDVARYLRQKNGIIDHGFYQFDAETEVYVKDVYDDILLRALYCDFTYTTVDATILDYARDDHGGYIDTHQLIALLFRKAQKCTLVGEDLDAKIDTVARRIIDAQIHDDEFSDLFAERIVVLYWAGYGSEVRRKWIGTIVRAQDVVSGGWRDDKDEINLHATALATAALSFYDSGYLQQKILR